MNKNITKFNVKREKMHERMNDCKYVCMGVYVENYRLGIFTMNLRTTICFCHKFDQYQLL